VKRLGERGPVLGPFEGLQLTPWSIDPPPDVLDFLEVCESGHFYSQSRRTGNRRSGRQPRARVCHRYTLKSCGFACRTACYCRRWYERLLSERKVTHEPGFVLLVLTKPDAGSHLSSVAVYSLSRSRSREEAQARDDPFEAKCAFFEENCKSQNFWP
jgi:hypothetical protein